jgi:hypothetical protein
MTSKSDDRSRGDMPQKMGSTIIKLAVVSLLVGMALKFSGINPQELLLNFGETVQSIFRMGVEFLRWAPEYILLGAVVVIPIWAIMVLLRIARGRKGS